MPAQTLPVWALLGGAIFRERIQKQYSETDLAQWSSINRDTLFSNVRKFGLHIRDDTDAQAVQKPPLADILNWDPGSPLGQDLDTLFHCVLSQYIPGDELQEQRQFPHIPTKVYVAVCGHLYTYLVPGISSCVIQFLLDSTVIHLQAVEQHRLSPTDFFLSPEQFSLFILDVASAWVETDSLFEARQFISCISECFIGTRDWVQYYFPLLRNIRTSTKPTEGVVQAAFDTLTLLSSNTANNQHLLHKAAHNATTTYSTASAQPWSDDAPTATTVSSHRAATPVLCSKKKLSKSISGTSSSSSSNTMPTMQPPSIASGFLGGKKGKAALSITNPCLMQLMQQDTAFVGNSSQQRPKKKVLEQHKEKGVENGNSPPRKCPTRHSVLYHASKRKQHQKTAQPATLPMSSDKPTKPKAHDTVLLRSVTALDATTKTQGMSDDCISYSQTVATNSGTMNSSGGLVGSVFFPTFHSSFAQLNELVVPPFISESEQGTGVQVTHEVAKFSTTTPYSYHHHRTDEDLDPPNGLVKSVHVKHPDALKEAIPPAVAELFDGKPMAVNCEARSRGSSAAHSKCDSSNSQQQHYSRSSSASHNSNVKGNNDELQKDSKITAVSNDLITTVNCTRLLGDLSPLLHTPPNSRIGSGNTVQHHLITPIINGATLTAHLKKKDDTQTDALPPDGAQPKLRLTLGGNGEVEVYEEDLNDNQLALLNAFKGPNKHCIQEHEPLPATGFIFPVDPRLQYYIQNNGRTDWEEKLLQDQHKALMEKDRTPQTPLQFFLQGLKESKKIQQKWSKRQKTKAKDGKAGSGHFDITQKTQRPSARGNNTDSISLTSAVDHNSTSFSNNNVGTMYDAEGIKTHQMMAASIQQHNGENVRVIPNLSTKEGLAVTTRVQPHVEHGFFGWNEATPYHITLLKPKSINSKWSHQKSKDRKAGRLNMANINAKPNRDLMKVMQDMKTIASSATTKQPLKSMDTSTVSGGSTQGLSASSTVSSRQKQPATDTVPVDAKHAYVGYSAVNPTSVPTNCARLASAQQETQTTDSRSNQGHTEEQTYNQYTKQQLVTMWPTTDVQSIAKHSLSKYWSVIEDNFQSKQVLQRLKEEAGKREEDIQNMKMANYSTIERNFCTPLAAENRFHLSKQFRSKYTRNWLNNTNKAMQECVELFQKHGNSIGVGTSDDDPTDDTDEQTMEQETPTSSLACGGDIEKSSANDSHIDTNDCVSDNLKSKPKQLSIEPHSADAIHLASKGPKSQKVATAIRGFKKFKQSITSYKQTQDLPTTPPSSSPSESDSSYSSSSGSESPRSPASPASRISRHSKRSEKSLDHVQSPVSRNTYQQSFCSQSENEHISDKPQTPPTPQQRQVRVVDSTKNTLLTDDEGNESSGSSSCEDFASMSLLARLRHNRRKKKLLTEETVEEMKKDADKNVEEFTSKLDELGEEHRKLNNIRRLLVNTNSSTITLNGVVESGSPKKRNGPQSVLVRHTAPCKTVVNTPSGDTDAAANTVYIPNIGGRLKNKSQFYTKEIDDGSYLLLQRRLAGLREG